MVTEKHLKILMVWVCTFVLTLAASSCKKEPQPTPPPPEQGTAANVPAETKTTTPTSDVVSKTPTPPEAEDDRLQVVPLVGLGPITFGMSKDQIIGLLGEPDKIEAGGMMLQYFKTIGVVMLIDPVKGLRAIDILSKQFPQAPPELITFPGKTKEGIAMGANREQIVAAYGEPDSTSVRGVFEILHYDKLATQFLLVENELVNIKIRAPG